MRVAVFKGAGRPIAIETVPAVDLASDEVRIAVRRCGVCGSDVALTSGSAFDYAVGCPLGHEYSGEVIEVGRSVTELREGDKVACIPKLGCGGCDACLHGHHFWCPTGPMVFGGFGDVVVAPAAAAFRLPAGLSFADGALVEPMACGLHALNLVGSIEGHTLLVLGAGSIGLSMIFWARQRRVGKVIVASRGGARRDIAMAMGADAFYSLTEQGEEFQRVLAADAPGIVAECVGKPGLLQQALERVRPGGTVLSMGMCTAGDQVLPALAAFKQLRLLFPLAYSRDEYEETIRVFDAGAIRAELMVSRVIPLEALPATIEMMRHDHNHLKIQVDPTMERENVTGQYADAARPD